MYSQNQEEKYILEYFGEFKGTLLDIGANDGKTLSNSLALIELGWKAVLVEPSDSAFHMLEQLHGENNNVQLFNLAISEEDCTIDFFDSGEHLGRGDTGLLSTLKESELERWKNSGMEFTKTKTEALSIESFFSIFRNKTFDFISIDAEGMDWEILKQIDLSKTETKLICVETNSIETEKYIDYCKQFGMRLIYKNAENILMGL